MFALKLNKNISVFNYIAQAPTPAICTIEDGCCKGNHHHHLTHCEKRTAAGAGGKLAEQLL